MKGKPMNTSNEFVTIHKNADLTTIIYVMTVEPDLQDNLVQQVRKLYASLTRESGFVSVTVLRSLDGLRVATYEQWKNEAQLKAATETSAFQKGLSDLNTLVIEGTPRIYDVRHIGHLKPDDITTLQPGKRMIAFNEVTTTPDKQEALLEFMISVDGNAKQQAGYVSTNIHTSRDGVQNLNLVQFESKEIMLAGLEKVIAQVSQKDNNVSLQSVKGLGTTDLHLFEVVLSFYKSNVYEATSESKLGEANVVEAKPEGSEVEARLATLQSKLTPAIRDSIDGVYGFSFTDNKQHYTIDARREVGQGLLSGLPETHGLNARATMSSSSADFVKLLSGQLLAPIAVMSGRLRVKGNPKDLPKLVPLFS
jgi:quinol monooxygenase YgiN